MNGNMVDRIFDATIYEDDDSQPEVCCDDPINGDLYRIIAPRRSSRTPRIDLSSIVIAVDGACSGNGTRHAQGAFAAFVHPRNYDLNTSLLLQGPVQTNQRAELSAGLLALDIARQIKDRNDYYTDPRYGNRRRAIAHVHAEPELSSLVIKTDSAYLVNAMTSWIYQRNQNGFVNSSNGLVVNTDLFQSIDDAIIELNARGVRVQFWRVPRAPNQMADYLANCKLHGISAKDAMVRFWGTMSDRE